MLRKIALALVALTLLVTMIFIGIGAFSPSLYQGSKSATLDAPPARVWDILTDVEGLPGRRREVVRVEVLDRKDGRPQKWKEFTDMGGHVVFEKIEEVPAKKLSLRMSESTFGMTGTWTYELEGSEMTKITITEESSIKSIPVRTVMTLAGRDGNLRKEISILVQALKAPSPAR